MSQKIKVKAFRQVQGEVKEIRRFTVFPTYDVSLYELLLEEIKELFGVSSFKLCYKDNDGDVVVFSSQRELEESLEFLKDDTLHVYVIQSPNIPLVLKVKK